MLCMKTSETHILKLNLPKSLTLSGTIMKKGSKFYECFDVKSKQIHKFERIAFRLSSK